MKGKALLKTNGKFYIVDLGIRNHLLGYTPYNRGFSYENLVYFELLRRGYDVSIGKIGTLEVDFRAVKNNEITYFQVTESLINDSTRNREIHPFQCIDDHYDKIILSLDKGYSNINGIKVINLIDWFLLYLLFKLYFHYITTEKTLILRSGYFQNIWFPSVYLSLRF